MNEVKIFENEQFGNVRTITINNEPWFVLKDICDTFGETNYRRISGKLDDTEKGVSQIDTPGGTQNMTIVNESGLYSTLFAMQPEKARGVTEEYITDRQNRLRSFKLWITHDVLPFIRKHGAYIAPDTIEKILHDPDTLISLAQQLKAEREKVAELTPKAEYYDTVSASEGSLNFRETAKILGIPEKKFIAAIEKHKLCYRNADKKLIPYAQRIDSGWFEVKEVPYFTTNGTRTTPQTLITPFGREKIFALIKGKN